MEGIRTLKEIAQELKKAKDKVTLLYAFNGTGKTRLSMKYKELVGEVTEDGQIFKALYTIMHLQKIYFTGITILNMELMSDENNRESTFFNFIERQGKEYEIVETFKAFASSKIEPKIDTKQGNTFSIPTGDDNSINNIKISKGEEYFYLECFYVLLESVIAELNIDDINDRSTNEFNKINSIFIDDPISSLTIIMR